MSLIDSLIESGYLKTPAIVDAFRKIDRKDFLPRGKEDRAEVDAPIRIGHGQTISQPATVAFMIELLQPQAGDKILDVGCGSGWTTALLSEIVREGGEVHALEIIKELSEFTKVNVSKYNFIKNSVAHVYHVDGRQGLPKIAPFDKILVSAAAGEIPPVLLAQLKTGGRLVMPVGKRLRSQDMVVINKVADNEFKEERIPGFIFVPLV